ncbi:hypothetical protein H310_07497 [Aphanomyces invadans]|uniref:Uncharacterized protein n=1 Tax=Aphanomyces invadans TaxID=157072 RepID=A0A024U381_9STRA|nr:hypothetical protein H310_07497 [Aphanomyces invadans]ETW00068.1 hypothetical protein H310_07497 [Aphanomyces invadans]|eukprot:XP_008871093.1 hypothetical protein H310_07497 [Aphanomyces invadans]
MPLDSFLKRLDQFLPPKLIQVPLFHAVDVAFQPHQTYRLSLVHHDQAFIFTLQSVVLIVNSILCFFLSVGFLLCAFLVQILRILVLSNGDKMHGKLTVATWMLGQHKIVSPLTTSTHSVPPHEHHTARAVERGEATLDL